MSWRTRKSYEGFRSRYLGDLRHMLRCCQAGRLPPANIPYLEASFSMRIGSQSQGKSPSGSPHLRAAPKQQAVDPAAHRHDQGATRREATEKDRQRKKLKRDRDRAAYRAAVASKKPWLKAGLKKSTYYYRLAKGKWSGRTDVQGVRNHPLPAPLGRVLINRVW